MTKMNYPDDGGLKEPVRGIDEGHTVFEVLRKHFGIQRIHPDPLSRGEQFEIIRIPGLLYKCHNIRANAGHVKIFNSRPGRGWAIYRYGRTSEEWAMHRVWQFGLFAIHHIEAGKKSVDPAGWHIRWAKLKLSAAIQPADTYRATKPEWQR